MRPRQIESDRALGREELGVDAAGPQPEIVEATACQFGHERAGGYHRDRGGAVEAAQRRVGPALGDREARADVLGKARRIARRERQSALDAVAPHEVPDRAFGCDVNGIRRGALDAARNLARIRQRQAQAAIGRHRYRGEALGRQELDGDALLAQALGERHQRADDAVDLRMPSIGRDEQAHWTLRQLCCVASPARQANDEQREKAAYGGPVCVTCTGDGSPTRLDEHTKRLFHSCDSGCGDCGACDFGRIISAHVARRRLSCQFHEAKCEANSFLQRTKVRHRTGTRLSSTGHALNIPSWRFAASPSGSEERSWRIACRTFSGRRDAR